IVLGPGLFAARPRMTGNERLPIHRDDLFQPLLDVGHISVGHAAELHALDRDPVDREDDLLLRQPHHQRAVGMILADIVEFERGATERDVPLAANYLVGNDHVIGLERSNAGLGVGVGDKGRAEILECLAAGDVVEMAVAVDDVLDRRLGHGLDRVDIGLCRPALADWVGRNHPRGRDDEHRLMVAVAKDIDVVGDLGGGERRRRGLLRLHGGGEHARDDDRDHAREMNPQHGGSSPTLSSTGRCRPKKQPAAAMLIPVQSTLIPASRTTAAARSKSDLIWAANSPGVLPTAVNPNTARRSCVCGRATNSAIRRAKRSTIDGGVRAGATRPITSSVSWPARPLSAMVGTSGAMGDRFGLVTANACSVPSLMNGGAGGSPVWATRVWPAAVELSMGAAPGTGMRTIGSFKVRRKSLSVFRRFCPRLIDAKLYFAGSARASVANSWTVFAGTDGCSRSTDGEREMM